MINMLTFAVVALVFGGKKFLQKVAPEQGYLFTLAIVLTALTVLFAWFKPDISFWNLGLSSIVLLVVFVVGMRIVYNRRPQEGDSSDDPPGISLTRAWVMFGLVSVGVIIAGYFLAYSVDQIAGITGVASSTLGILLASLVTTIPEATATIAAARIGAADLGVGNLIGSCAFNVTILAYADPFYRQGIILNQTEPTHFVAGGVAIGLMLVGLVLVLAHRRLHRVVVSVVLAVMAAGYLAGAVAVARLGSPGVVGADAARSGPQDP
jgi:cation:H+ antiporter